MDIASILNSKRIEKIGARKERRVSERAELIAYFAEKLNARQKELGKKPYPFSFVGMKLAHLSVFDLYYLKRITEDSKNWHKTFWGSLKTVDKNID